MTVTIGVRTRVFTIEEKRELVLGYLEYQWGKKEEFLAAHGVSRYQIRDWKAAMADGDLGEGLVPRKRGGFTKDDVEEVRRLQKENAKLRAEKERVEVERDRYVKVADALGKAIDVMQKHGGVSDEDARS